MTRGLDIFLKQSKEMNLLRRKEVRDQYEYLLRHSCTTPVWFSEQQFKSFMEWDTDALASSAYDGSLSLHLAAQYPPIHCFKYVFEVGIRYFPKKKELACEKHGREKSDEGGRASLDR